MLDQHSRSAVCCVQEASLSEAAPNCRIHHLGCACRAGSGLWSHARNGKGKIGSTAIYECPLLAQCLGPDQWAAIADLASWCSLGLCAELASLYEASAEGTSAGFCSLAE